MIQCYYARTAKRFVIVQGDDLVMMSMSEARRVLHDMQDAIWSYENDMIDKEIDDADYAY